MALTTIRKGEVFTLDNLTGRIFNTQHIPVRDSGKVIGRTAARDISAGEPIQSGDLA